MDTQSALIDSIGTRVITDEVNINGHSINYVASGKGKPLVLLHGATIGWGMWYKNVKYLSKHYKVIAIDLPGCGSSSKLHFYRSDLEEDFVGIVVKFINKKRLSKVGVVGHSTGGWVAVKVALAIPDKVDRLVLVNPLGFSNYIPPMYRPISFYPIAHFFTKTIVRPTRANLRKFLESSVYDTSSIEEIFVEYLYQSVRKHPDSHPLLLMSRIAGFSSIKEEFVITNMEISRLGIPTLIIAGKEDRLTPVSVINKVVAGKKNIKMRVMENTAHVPPIEKPSRFNKTVQDFIG